MATIRRRLYSGSGYPLSNGAGTPITYTVESDSIEQAILDVVTEIRAVLGGPGSTITQMLGASAQQQQQIAVYSRGAAALGVLGSLIAPEVGVPLALGAEIIAIANELDLTGDVEAPPEMPVSYTKGLTDGTYPVTPVTPAPAGYGGGDPEDVADAVFAHPLPWQNATGEVNLNFHWWLVEVMAALGPSAWASGVPDPRNPYFALVASYPSAVTYGALIPWSASAIPPVPALDLTAVLPDDTVLSYLNREVDSYTWTNQGPWGEATPAGVFAALSGDYAGYYWRCKLTDDELHLLAQAAGAAGTVHPPIWPGLAGVTLGAPVVLTDDGRVEATMHGCLLEITATDPGSGRIEFEGNSWWYRAGFLAFEDADGNLERHDYLNRELGVYTCQTMRQASAVVVHLDRASQVTVTPWTLAA